MTIVMFVWFEIEKNWIRQYNITGNTRKSFKIHLFHNIIAVDVKHKLFQNHEYESAKTNLIIILKPPTDFQTVHDHVSRH